VDAVAFCGVRLVLGQRPVLADVSLAVLPGEFVGVFGPNGAGKTTLLRAILGLVAPSAGTIRVLGRPVRRGNPEIGYLPQGHGAAPPSTLRGRDFVASIVRGHRLGLPTLGRQDRAEIDRALDLVGARELARRPLAELSGGERQRLLLAQGLIGKPQLLLLDEPLISLDPHREREVVALVKRVQRELGIAVLFSAHELNPLIGAMDRALYLGQGQAAIGTVDEVFTGPVLSRLYGCEIEVLRLGGRILVMADGREVEHDPHRHGAHDDRHTAAMHPERLAARDV
jgi:zinc/manganese transport system ATP-binding protein